MKKMRRVVAMLMCVAVVVVSLFMTGVTVISPELQQAKRLTAQLFGIVNEIEKDLHKAPAYGISEEEMEEELVNKYLYARYLKGADEQDDYILVTGNNVGYAIYDRDTMELIEYSENSYSPFGQIKDSESFYAGPGNYLKKQNNEIEHIITKEKLDRATAKEIGKAVKNKIKLDKQRQNEKTVVEEIITVDSINESATVQSSGVLPNPLPSADEQVTVSSKYVEDILYCTSCNRTMATEEHLFNIIETLVGGHEYSETMEDAYHKEKCGCGYEELVEHSYGAPTAYNIGQVDYEIRNTFCKY